MRKKRRNRWYTFLIVVGAYLLSVYCAVLEPERSLAVGWPAQYLYLIPLFLCFTRFGAVRLGEVEHAEKLDKWLIKLLLGAFLYFLILTIIQYAVISNGPYMAQIHISPALYWEEALSWRVDNWSDWAAWGMIFMWVLVLAYSTYVKKGVPCLHHTVATFFPTSGVWITHIKAYVERNIYLTSTLVMSLAWLAVCILIGSGMLKVFGIANYLSVPVVTTACIAYGILYFNTKMAERHLSFLARYGLSLNSLCLMVVSIVLILFGLSGFLTGHFFQRMPSIVAFTQCDCMPSILRLFPEARMQGLHWGLWILTLPLIISYMTSISKGRTVREVVIAGVLLVPLFFMGLKWGMAQVLGQNWMNVIIEKSVLPEYQIGIGLILAVMLVVIQWGRKSSWLFSNGFMKRPDIYPLSEVSLYDGTKMRGMGLTGRKFMLTFIMLVLAHSAGGWYIVGIQLLIFSPILLCLFYVGSIIVLIELYKEGMFSFRTKIFANNKYTENTIAK